MLKNQKKLIHKGRRRIIHPFRSKPIKMMMAATCRASCHSDQAKLSLKVVECLIKILTQGLGLPALNH
jgi:hypothetical protein